jgi:Rv2258c-like winged HTH domain
MNTQEIDQQKAEAFAGRMIGALNEGAIAVMTSIGHRTGLFDAMSGLPYSTSGEIASAANLDERYVREWLGAMVVGGIVEHNPEEGSYKLPPEHAAFLTRAASPDNIAVTAQFISVMGSVEDKIVEVFRHGGGVPYSAYPRFHEVMAEDSGQTVVAALFEHILRSCLDCPSASKGASRSSTSAAVAAGHSTLWPVPSPTAASPATTSPRRGCSGP